MNQIPLEQYKEILSVMPIFCVDIIIQNGRGEYLLVKRSNEPLKEEWWIIGGRVLKGETMEEAVVRKVKQETGILVKEMEPIGYFELVEGANPFGLSFKYHSMSVVFKVVIGDSQPVKLDEQSAEYKFAKELPAGLAIKPFLAKKKGEL